MEMKLTNFNNMPADGQIDSAINYVILPRDLWNQLIGLLNPDQHASFYDIAADFEDGPYDVNFRN